MADDEIEYEGEMFSYYEDKGSYPCPTCGDSVCGSYAGRPSFNEETANESDAPPDDNELEPSETSSDVDRFAGSNDGARDTRYSDLSRDTETEDESSSVDTESEHENDGENMDPGVEEGVEEGGVDMDSEHENDGENMGPGVEEGGVDTWFEHENYGGSIGSGEEGHGGGNDLNSGVYSRPTHHEPAEYEYPLHRERDYENYEDTEDDE